MSRYYPPLSAAARSSALKKSTPKPDTGNAVDLPLPGDQQQRTLWAISTRRNRDQRLLACPLADPCGCACHCDQRYPSAPAPLPPLLRARRQIAHGDQLSASVVLVLLSLAALLRLYSLSMSGERGTKVAIVNAAKRSANLYSPVRLR